jgi:RNA polymerase sigma-70 factor (ECF subfamily)
MREGPSSSDVELVGRARGGDAAAFGLLVERHQDHIYGAVCHLVGSGHDAEDIAQEVFVLAYANLGGFRGKAKFSTWLYGIMLNAVRSHWRRRQRRAVVSLAASEEEDEASPDPPAREDGPQEASMRQESVQVVRAAIAGLDPELREIVVLRDIQGLNYEELAQALELAPGTVKSRLHRARQALKDKLEPLYGGSQ